MNRYFLALFAIGILSSMVKGELRVQEVRRLVTRMKTPQTLGPVRAALFEG